MTVFEKKTPIETLTNVHADTEADYLATTIAKVMKDTSFGRAVFSCSAIQPPFDNKPPFDP